MRYLSVISEQVGETLGDAIWACTRPVHVRQSEDITTRYSDPVLHPTAGRWALPVQDSPIYIHPECDVTVFDPLLSMFIQEGVITEEDAGGLRQRLTLARGSRIDIVENLPDVWREAAMSPEQWEHLQ